MNVAQAGFITVEEAASISERSVATIRRWAKSGEIVAQKVGKQWLVDPGSLPRRRSGKRRGKLSSPRLDLKKALTQLENVDLKEVWVPDVVLHRDQLAQPEALLRSASDRLVADGPFDPLLEVEVPKTPFFVRTGHLLSLEDRIAYHAAVASMSERIEGHRAPTVYSARLSKDDRYLLQKGRDLWVEWKDSVVKVIGSGWSWMIKTDVTAYFDNIAHPLLFADIDSLNPDPAIARSLKRMLSDWSQVRGRGIPQGPDASRLLGNLYLAPIDQAMSNGPWQYRRYMDDIRVLGRTRAEAINGMRILERECKRRGLILSAQKTEMLVADEAADDFEDEDLNTIHYLFQAGMNTQAKPALRKVLARSLGRDGQLRVRPAKFTLWRLALLRDSIGLRRVLQRLEDFAPIAGVVTAYLRPWIGRPSVDREIARFLLDQDRNTSTFLSTWILALMLDRVGIQSPEWTEYAAMVARNRNEPSYLRGIAANVMARGNRTIDVQWLQQEIRTELDSFLVRSYVVALFRVGALDGPSAGHARRRFAEVSRTLDYLKDRTRLPSLIFNRLSVNVP